ncbi:tripartite tricarboxylate transporter substrate binding protein [Pigmentiphaga soli]|uniref:Tripartite tricarboxylate transporter substrate binding protein n=1 Tax=Pigmentiphaga soli TaxID=1007095 RepID=A0ABP8GHM4_9BURK
MKAITAAALALAGLLPFTPPAGAQPYPDKPIRIIVPFAPGGSTDVVIRLLAPRLTEQLGQSVVVENRPGGGAIIGMNVVARAAPDGYTLGVASLSFGANPFLHSEMPFDAERDFAPISLVALVPMVMAVNPSVPAHSVQELVALAKKNPGQINYASAGTGSSNHLATELLAYLTGSKMTHVPYKSGGEAVTSIVGGQTSVLFATIPSALQYFKAGRLRGLAVTSAQRDPTLPDIPTVAESGVPGYEVNDWQGLYAPAGTPPAVVARVHQALTAALAQPGVKEGIERVGAHPVGSTPEELSAYLKNQLATWSKVIKAANIRID